MTTTTMTAVAILTLSAGFAAANPVDGDYTDGPRCDNHGFLRAIEELGTGPLFPDDELIDAVWNITQQSACAGSDNPDMANALVEMINLTDQHWDNLFYVADPETGLSNIDGTGMSFAAPGVRTAAFRIDFVGVNRPLVFESMTPDGIFEPGEIWGFIIQDYTNAFGLTPDMMGSLDFAGASSGDSFSSGSIVQFVPAPGSLALLGLGGLAVLRRRR